MIQGKTETWSCVIIRVDKPELRCVKSGGTKAMNEASLKEKRNKNPPWRELRDAEKFIISASHANFAGTKPSIAEWAWTHSERSATTDMLLFELFRSSEKKAEPVSEFTKWAEKNFFSEYFSGNKFWLAGSVALLVDTWNHEKRTNAGFSFYRSMNGRDSWTMTWGSRHFLDSGKLFPVVSLISKFIRKITKKQLSFVGIKLNPKTSPFDIKTISKTNLSRNFPQQITRQRSLTLRSLHHQSDPKSASNIFLH